MEKVEEKGGGRYGEKSKEVWRKNSGFVIRLFYKLSILTIKEDSQDSQNWRKGGGKKEETLCRWRKVEEKNGGRYGGKSGGVFK